MTKTHWKQMHNPDYLGAYALNPGEDMILTIKLVRQETVTGPDNRKEECAVLHFVENVKPMILNVTNSKTIQKLHKTPYIEDWAGRKIQVYIDQVKAFGDVVEALRIRPFLPKQSGPVTTTCADCSATLEDYNGATAEQIAKHTLRKYGKVLCTSCANVLNEKQKAEAIPDPLAKEDINAKP